MIQWYVLVCSEYIPVYALLSWFGTAFLLFLQGTYVHMLTQTRRISEYILSTSWLFCWPAWPSRFGCRVFMHWGMHWTKAHYIRFINCCLATPLPVTARLAVPVHDFTTGLLCWCAGGISCCWSALHDLLSSSCLDDDHWSVPVSYYSMVCARLYLVATSMNYVVRTCTEDGPVCNWYKQVHTSMYLVHSSMYKHVLRMY